MPGRFGKGLCPKRCEVQVEFKKWCPAFKLLTYFGSAKERKTKRQGWSKPNAFHVVITSYTLILQVPSSAVVW